MPTLYGNGSPNVLKVLIALEELELSFKFAEIDAFAGDQYSEAFAALNPNRKVPVLVDESLTIWESGAILVYLAEHYGKFLPTEPGARYATLQWLMLQVASIGPMCGQLVHFTLYAPQDEHAYSRARYATEVRRLYDVVEGRLRQSAFLGGDEYSIADMAAWPWLRAVERRGVDPAQLPSTMRWIRAVEARPAVGRALAFVEAMAAPDIGRIMRERPADVDRFVQRGDWSRA